MNKKIIALCAISVILVSLFSGCIEEDKKSLNKRPEVVIIHPRDYDTVSKIVTISGEAFDPNGDNTIKTVIKRVKNGQD